MGKLSYFFVGIGTILMIIKHIFGITENAAIVIMQLVFISIGMILFITNKEKHNRGKK